MQPKHDPDTCKLSALKTAQARAGKAGQWLCRRPGALMLVAGATIFGGSGMVAWLAFLLLGAPGGVDFDLGIAGRLAVDTLLCLLFFTQHSLMVRRHFRLQLTRFIHADFQGAFYATAAGICLLVLVGLWQPAGPFLWQPAGWVRWSMGLVFLTAGMAAWWGARSLGEFDVLGVTPALRAVNGQRPAGQIPFAVRGPYRWVRHPLYLFSLIILWSGPVFTVDRLLHNILWTVWVVIGAAMEERDLADCFGDAYRSYQQTVPMLLPISLKPLVPDSVTHPSAPP